MLRCSASLHISLKVYIGKELTNFVDVSEVIETSRGSLLQFLSFYYLFIYNYK